ncbi:MAG: GNAT family N-acetyltransferase, partial [Lachnospiraceae bacterium]|nr:GNAT family N-acetyltransferase [Lachnospiraceae bacterium]
HGKEVLFQLESMLIERHTKQIRIDVVDDYKENVVGFWKKQGYKEVEAVKLQWNGYESNAIKMYKTL